MNKLIKLFIVLVVIILVVMGIYYKYKKYPIYDYKVVNVYPHDTSAWCQGLEVNGNYFYEGTGRKKGLSTLRKVHIRTGEVIKHISLEEKYFGEGITILEDKVYQLTYTAGDGFVYEKDTFNLINEFKYLTEGWGLTNNGENLIMSDGSSTIRFINPQDFQELRSIKVRNNGFAVRNLNELEYFDERIYANILFSDYIVIISPETGEVSGWIDLSEILSNEERKKHEVDVLNCIAANPQNGNLFVTGKLWPKMFEIKLIDKF